MAPPWAIPQASCALALVLKVTALGHLVLKVTSGEPSFSARCCRGQIIHSSAICASLLDFMQIHLTPAGSQPLCPCAPAGHKHSVKQRASIPVGHTELQGQTHCQVPGEVIACTLLHSRHKWPRSISQRKDNPSQSLKAEGDTVRYLCKCPEAKDPSMPLIGAQMASR